MDFLSCSIDCCPHNLLNIYSGIKLPSLPVSILYGICTVFSVTCISRSAVISDCLLFKYTEFILNYSILPSSWDTSTSNSWTVQSFLLQHTFLKWPNLLQLAHVFPYAGHSLSGCIYPHYLHGWYGDDLCVAFCPAWCFSTFTWLNLWESVMSLSIAACFLCASTLLAQISTFSLVVWTLPPFVVSSLITSSSIILLFRPWMNCSLSWWSSSL